MCPEVSVSDARARTGNARPYVRMGRKRGGSWQHVVLRTHTTPTCESPFCGKDIFQSAFRAFISQSEKYITACVTAAFKDRSRI